MRGPDNSNGACDYFAKVSAMVMGGKTKLALAVGCQEVHEHFAGLRAERQDLRLRLGAPDVHGAPRINTKTRFSYGDLATPWNFAHGAMVEQVLAEGQPQAKRRGNRNHWGLLLIWGAPTVQNEWFLVHFSLKTPRKRPSANSNKTPRGSW